MKTPFCIAIISLCLVSGCAYVGGRANHQIAPAPAGTNVEVNQGPQTNAFTQSPSQKANENAAKMINPIQ